MNETFIVAVDADIVDLAEIFLSNRRGQIQSWREAVATGNLPLLSRLGHELKGTAGAFGFHQLSRLGAELEEKVTKEDLDGAGDTLERMIEFFDHVAISTR